MSLEQIIDCIDRDGHEVHDIEFMTHLTCDPMFMPREKTVGLTYSERLHYEEIYLDEFQCRYCKIKCDGETERDEHEFEHKNNIWWQYNPIEIQLMRDNYEDGMN